jgi:hypothetical protein
MKAWTMQDIEGLTQEELVAQSKTLMRVLASELQGKHPIVQGAVLAECTAIWLAGHPSNLHKDMLDKQVELIRNLLGLYVRRAEAAS